MASKSANPFDLLTEIAHKSVQYSAGLPEQDEAVELWNGIGFTIADSYFVAAMGSVSEIIHLPKFTSIPGVQSWMLGVANVRGRLLPIMDLGLFFDLNHRSSNSRDKRVLIFDHGEILSGFVVDSVHGMQYFAADSFKDKPDKKLEKTIQPFVKGAYEKNNRKWNVFDTFNVVENQRFLEVSVR